MSERFMAMLALERADPVTAETLINRFKQRFRDHAARLAPTALAREVAPDSPLLIQFGETVVTVMKIDAPLPREALDGALRANLTWPDAAARLADNRAHLIVTTLSGCDGHAEAIDQAGLVTLAAAALADLVPAVGIYWTPGETVTEAQQFQAYASGLAGGHAPTDVWVQILFMKGEPLPSGAETWAAITLGLQPFVGREIEFWPRPLSKVTIAERVIGTIQYLLDKGLVLDDGDTLGVSDSERIRVRYRPRGQRPDVPVLVLTVEHIDERATPSQPTPKATTRPSFGRRRQAR